ncbi:hypothetical protein [Chengkuizengella sediminis]|uniref:hypothetical protein n=1 Tax=Chengkuizengella sediminis TaxID=1885917 RepID=UPI00138A5FBF|nr:hypothetical protein [Chengkuizengella sediminis]NDI35687.1 hypothetical protein [Chengkuizengella sediminis]
MISFIKWVFIFIVLYLIFNIVKGALKIKRVFNGGIGSRQIDKCPACGQIIQVPSGESDEFLCPKCNTKLGRTSDGKLLIKVN